MAVPRVLIAGIGNLFRCDDGLGVRAVRLLAQRYRVPENVEIVEAGTQALKLLDGLRGCDRAILVDAVDGSRPPGTVYDLSIDDIPDDPAAPVTTHSMGAAELVRIARRLGPLPTIQVVGMQPLDALSFGTELTRPVAASLERLVNTMAQLLEQWGIALERVET